jgi:hypothetical protein
MIGKILMTAGIICFLIAGLMMDGWKLKTLAVIYALANYIIFLK